MKVLYATAECWPFAKTGGLGSYAPIFNLLIDSAIKSSMYECLPSLTHLYIDFINSYRLYRKMRRRICINSTKLYGRKYRLYKNDRVS